MTKQHVRKSFILDTNVILHDSSCIKHFDEHDIIVPITVLEELDHFKKGNQSVNFHAREFVRSLDCLSANKLFNGGVSLGEGKGRLSIKLELAPHPELVHHFPASAKPDHQILNICYHLHKEDTSRLFILVTKDVNLRMKAKAVGLMAENYITDHVKDLGALYTGTRVINDNPFGLIDELHTREEIPANDLDLPPGEPLTANEFIILREANKSALATYHAGENRVHIIHKQKVCGILPRNAEQTFAVHALCNPAVPLVTISGKAGTGKTLLALASALEQRRNYRQIMLARPVVPLSNKDLGFLPGDIQSKIGPYMQPLYDNLAVIRSQFQKQSKMHQKLHDLLEEKTDHRAPCLYQGQKPGQDVYHH